jgi:hypothetical protein
LGIAILSVGLIAVLAASVGIALAISRDDAAAADPDPGQAAWEPYVPSMTLVLSPEPGIKYVTAWFAGAAWNVSAPA